MNAIKNVVVITVLLGVTYAVYTSITSQPDSSGPPELADGWPTSVDVQLPGKSESKPAPSKNPFASGGTQATDRIVARDAAPAGSRLEPRSLASPASRPAAPARSLQAGSLAPSPSREVPGEQPRWPSGDSAPAERTASSQRAGMALSTDLPPPAGQSASPPMQRRTPAAPSGPGAVRKEFQELMEDAHRRLVQGELAEVHLALSRLYGNADLTAEESQQLTELLDQLAGSVIYSRKHLVEPPYVVKAGDTLPQIAQDYNVPWQLLAKINGVRDPERLEPGRQLKVMRGPFEALVSLERYELALMVGGRYAGRFPIGVGRDQPQLEGSYAVRRKLAGPAQVGPDRAAGAGDANSTAGTLSIELDDRIAICGTSDLQNLRRADGPGAICLGPRDIEDVYDILSASTDSSRGSKVTIRR